MEAIKCVRHLLTKCLIVGFLFSQCQSTAQDYPEKIGGIAFDPKLDDANFFLCNERFIPEGYQVDTIYEGEAWMVVEQLKAGFQYDERFKGSGYVTVRFVVNCKGETGRYRVLQVDDHYQPTEFSEPLLNHLLLLTKGLKEWKAGEYRGQRFDSYEHIIFKIDEGRLALITF